MDDNAYGVILKRGAHASMVSYSCGGVHYEIMMLNEDFIIIEDIEEEF